MDIQEKAERWAAEKEPPEVLCRPGIQQPEEEEEERRGPHRHGKDLNWDWKPMERDDSGIQQTQEHQGHWPFRMGRSSKEACSPHSPVQTGPVTQQGEAAGKPCGLPVCWWRHCWPGRNSKEAASTSYPWSRLYAAGHGAVWDDNTWSNWRRRNLILMFFDWLCRPGQWSGLLFGG